MNYIRELFANKVWTDHLDILFRESTGIHSTNNPVLQFKLNIRKGYGWLGWRQGVGYESGSLARILMNSTKIMG